MNACLVAGYHDYVTQNVCHKGTVAAALYRQTFAYCRLTCYKEDLSIVPPEGWLFGTIPQDLRRNIRSSHTLPLLPVPSLIVKDHPHAETKSQDNTGGTKRCGCAESRDVVWGIL